MIETKVQIAADLLPLIQHLWKGGVLSIGTYSNSIHLQDTLFHETFPDVLTPVERRTDGYWAFEKKEIIDGREIRFYCLSEKEGWE